MTYATRFPWSPPIRKPPNPLKHYLQQIDPCQWLGLWANGDQVRHSSNGHNRDQRPIKGYRVSLTAKPLYMSTKTASIEAARTSDAISELCGGGEGCEERCPSDTILICQTAYLNANYVHPCWLVCLISSGGIARGGYCCVVFRTECLSWSVCRWDTVHRVIRHCVTPGANPETVTERKDYFNKSSEVTDNNS